MTREELLLRLKCLDDGDFDATYERQADFIIALETAILEEIEKPLESIVEYWNRSENSSAMSDALYHNIDTAKEALSIIKRRKGWK